MDLSNNNISNISGLQLSKYESINLKNQVIDVTVKDTVNQYTYPSIFTEAKKSTSKLYSSTGFTFTGCKEKSDGTGIELTADEAIVKINAGNAAGTTITITREVDNPPTIEMYDASTNKKITSGTTIDVNTNVRLVFSDDDSISGYNITQSTTQPTTWLTQYDQTPIANIRIVSKKFSIVGNNYIWVKDSGGKVTKELLVVKGSDELLGDVDGNGTINLTDVLKLRRYLANSTKWSLTDAEKTRADVNKDEKINLSDVLKLRRYLAAQSNSSIKTKHPDWMW